VVDTALELRRLLQDEGFKPWPKITGGKGVHLMAPMRQPMTRDGAHAWSHAITSNASQLNSDPFGCPDGSHTSHWDQRVVAVVIRYLKGVQVQRSKCLKWIGSFFSATTIDRIC
jgi:DNA primase